MITTCSRLPLAGFILCGKGEFMALAETNEERSDAFEEQRKEAALAINSEYCELMADNGIKTYVTEVSRMQELAYRIVSFTHIINTLSVWHYEPLAEVLRKEFGVELAPEDKEQYDADLDRIKVELTSDEIELERLQAMQGERVTEDNKDGVPDTYWDDLLSEIYTHVIKQPLMDTEEVKARMMTNVYAGYVKKLKQYYRSLATKPVTTTE